MKMTDIVEHAIACETKDAVVALLENAAEKYELRRKGTPRDHHLVRNEDGTPKRDHYLPHIPIDAQVYARSWKALKWAARTFDMTTSEAWSEVMLPYIERAIKEWKKGGK